MCKTMNAVINRTMSIAERTGPSLRTSGAKLVLPQEINAAIPAHCNKSVSVTITTAALASRTKIIGSPERGRTCFIHPDGPVDVYGMRMGPGPRLLVRG